MSVDDLAKYAGGELREIVARYEWSPEDTNGNSYGVSIKINIVRLYGGNKYYASSSHGVKTPRQAGPYQSMDYKDTIADALQDAIRGFKMFMGTVEETTWVKNEE